MSLRLMRSEFHSQFFNLVRFVHRCVVPFDQIRQRHYLLAIASAIAVELYVIGEEASADRCIHCRQWLASPPQDKAHVKSKCTPVPPLLRSYCRRRGSAEREACHW